MREITYFVAYDDTEFDTREECEQYENKVKSFFKQFNDVYDFLDEDKMKMEVSITSIEKTIDELDNAYNNCIYLRVKCIAPFVWRKVCEDYGWALPCEKGMYAYNGFTGEWDKVDE